MRTVDRAAAKIGAWRLVRAHPAHHVGGGRRGGGRGAPRVESGGDSGHGRHACGLWLTECITFCTPSLPRLHQPAAVQTFFHRTACTAMATTEVASPAAPQELFEGGCHCRAVRFRVAISKFDDALDCNCSICTMKGIGVQCLNSPDTVLSARRTASVPSLH